MLRQISGAPKCLHLRGLVIDANTPAVGIVGSRNPTPYGRHMARFIAGGLAAGGVTVISGFARGIDTEAHKAALERNSRTIAVLGCGMDIDYPRGSGELRSRIVQNGTLVSEFERGTPPLPGHFPARNRIISGLSLAVVVVQASLKSGSLITARWALDQGREVLAVPGRADDPLSAGPIALIKDGAAPVCHPDDIFTVLGLGSTVTPMSEHDTDRSENDPVLSALRLGPRLPEELSQFTGLPLTRILSKLSRLELEGLVIRYPGGRFSMK